MTTGEEVFVVLVADPADWRLGNGHQTFCVVKRSLGKAKGGFAIDGYVGIEDGCSVEERLLEHGGSAFVQVGWLEELPVLQYMALPGDGRLK